MNEKKTDKGGALETVFMEVAEKYGSELYPIDIGKIDPRESMRLKCQIPLCEYFDACKVCPPNIPSVSAFREALSNYRKAFLVVLREKIEDIKIYQKDFSAELKLADIIAHLELAAFENGFYQALGLGVGGCKLCDSCVPKGEPCRHPFKARPSPEGFGIDITKLAREAGVPVEWPPKEYVNFMGLILV
ncbi:MAG: DUF2284 domain-containing protein [Deltaproteobacteria bacterium]|nr:DUF2284 domain-containing protein [Deltaproteobacteria bacterium]